MKRGFSRRLDSQAVMAISDRLQQLREHIPTEFQRMPRSLAHVDTWKATECRQFLIYTGPIVLKKFLPASFYSNFLNFSVAMYLMLCPALCNYYCDFAGDLINHFLIEFEPLYGIDELIYNVHNLIHLADDVRRYGALDGVSAFPFENYMRKLKKATRKPQFVLKQIFNIISLEWAFLTSKKAKQTENKTPVLKMKHSCGPSIPNFPHCTQYKKAVFNEFCVAITPGDNCVMAGGNLGLVKNILCDERSYRKYILFGRFSRLDSLYSSPIEYKELGFIKQVVWKVQMK